MKYAILCHPGHNRVYFDTSLSLAVSEFALVAKSFSVMCSDAMQERMVGVPYLTFTAESALSAADASSIAGLSFFYALFMVKETKSSVCLTPIEAAQSCFVDDSMSTILKYTGKTNELFTRMMLNIAYYSQDNRDAIKLLDPVCGKGTTLYEGLTKGYCVSGIEINDVVVNEAYHFLKRYFETARYKFDCASIKLSGAQKSYTAHKHTLTVAKTKEDAKAKHVKTIELIAGNAMYANQYFKKNTFDMIVGDLPYGVQHGNVTREKQTSRNPTELLHNCLPAWVAVLKPGGALALSWNSNVLRRAKMVEALAQHGLSVFNEGAYTQLAHRVDQSILRDVVVARKG